MTITLRRRTLRIESPTLIVSPDWSHFFTEVGKNSEEEILPGTIECSLL